MEKATIMDRVDSIGLSGNCNNIFFLRSHTDNGTTLLLLLYTLIGLRMSEAPTGCLTGPGSPFFEGTDEVVC